MSLLLRLSHCVRITSSVRHWFDEHNMLMRLTVLDWSLQAETITRTGWCPQPITLSVIIIMYIIIIDPAWLDITIVRGCSHVLSIWWWWVGLWNIHWSHQSDNETTSLPYTYMYWLVFTMIFVSVFPINQLKHYTHPIPLASPPPPPHPPHKQTSSLISACG